jgi:hypothetical protein
MATIKFKRGSGVPTGLTAYEAAWDTSLGRFFINNGTTATWIGARIDPDTTLVGNCAYFVPTQNAVKTYVDNKVAGGAVSSVDGVTGAVDLLAGTGISITNPTGAAKGITLAVNSNVALLDTAQTFTALKQFTSGISASGGTFSGRVNVLPASGSNAFIDTNSGSLLYIGTTAGAAFAVDKGNNELEFWIDGTFNGYFNTSGFFITDGLGSLSQVPTTRTTVASLNGATGTVTIGAGTGLSLSTSVSSRGITFTNTGVVGITGTANQVAVNATTGSVTLSLPSAITAPGTLTVTGNLTASSDLTVTGNLTVNGTSTTVNSTTVTVQDPLIAIGGLTGNAPPVTGDVKDRGVLFQYFALASATGFFGHDRSAGAFTYIPTVTSVTGEVVTGTAGTALFNKVQGISGVTFTLEAAATTPALIEMRGGAAYNNTIISLESSIVEIGNYGTKSGIKFTENGRGHLLLPSSSMSANRTYDLPDHSGVVLVPADLGSIAGYVLTSAGLTGQPIWTKPDDPTGVASYSAKLLNVASDTSDASCYLTFINESTPGLKEFKYNSSLLYNSQTNYLDVNIDCGAY